MAWVAPRFYQPVIGSDRRRDSLRCACVTTNHANKGARVSAQNSRYEFATLCNSAVAALWFRTMGQEGGELTRNSKAHMLTMPMHTADESYCTILSASV